MLNGPRSSSTSSIGLLCIWLFNCSFVHSLTYSLIQIFIKHLITRSDFSPLNSNSILVFEYTVLSHFLNWPGRQKSNSLLPHLLEEVTMLRYLSFCYTSSLDTVAHNLKEPPSHSFYEANNNYHLLHITAHLLRNAPAPWLVWLGGWSAGLHRGRRLISQSGHVPGLWARSLAGACKRQLIHVSLSHRCFSPSFSPSLPLSLKINKYIFF